MWKQPRQLVMNDHSCVPKNYVEKKKESVIKETEKWSKAKEVQRVRFRWSVSSLVRGKQEESSLVWNWPPAEFEGSAQVSAIKAFYVTGKNVTSAVQSRGLCFGEKVKEDKEQVSGTRWDGYRHLRCAYPVNTPLCVSRSLSPFQSLSKDVLRSICDIHSFSSSECLMCTRHCSRCCS